MLTHRHRRWIALFALFGLLFQQLAMATYACPLERAALETEQVMAAMASCQSPAQTDLARCRQHCAPLAQTSDHAPAPSVPPALLPATTWSREFHAGCVCVADFAASAIDARATAPPLTIRDCTFQI